MALSRLPRTWAAAAALTAAALAGLAVPASAAAAGPDVEERRGRYVDVQLLALNDFHGALEPPTGSGGSVVTEDGTVVEAGGAAYLATHLRQLRSGHRNSWLVGAGDLVGGTPFLSAAFKDEPTVEFLNSVGMTASSTGNHEYDEGIAELLRIQYGGCSPSEGCFDDDGFAGADFDYLSANVVNSANGRRPFPAYAIRWAQGVPVGFVGVPLEGTPEIVSAEGIRGFEFRDEIASANRAVRLLKRRGVETIVLLLHEGAASSAPDNPPNGCEDVTGPARDIAEQVDPEIDVVFSGHYHVQFNCVVRDPAGRVRPLTQAASNGRLITEVQLRIDRRTGDVLRRQTTAENHVVTRDVRPDARTTALIEKYGTLVEPIANRVVGRITETISDEPDDSGESELGNLIADAQVAGAQGEEEGSQVALMNPGGIRADLIYESSTAGEGDGVVTYGEAFTVQPFNNVLTTMTLTGAQLDAVLEQQWQPQDDGSVIVRILAPSEALHYTWDESAPIGRKVSRITVDGERVTRGATYRVTVNSFLAGGGDAFTVLTEGTDRVSGQLDIDAFVDYLGENSPVSPPATDRIDVVK